MRKKKVLTIEKVAKELFKAGLQYLPLNENLYIVFYTRIMFETINSENNIFQPTTQQQKVVIPSYFLISYSEEQEKESTLCATVFNIKTKTVFAESFVGEEIIDFFIQNIF